MAIQLSSSIFSIQKFLFAETWMDLEIVTLSEVNQTEKDKKYHMILHVCGT